MTKYEKFCQNSICYTFVNKMAKINMTILFFLNKYKKKGDSRVWFVCGIIAEKKFT